MPNTHALQAAEITPQVRTLQGRPRPLLWLLAATAPLWLTTAAQSQVILSEVVASNVAGLQDEDNDTPDWIELHNRGEEAVDLAGFGLSDDPDEPFKWVFPAGAVLPAGTYQVVFASGKDRPGPLHTNFKISTSGEELSLTDPSGVLTDSLSTGELFVDDSVGRNEELERVFFKVPTPKAANDKLGLPAFTERFSVSPASGFFDEPVTLAVPDAPEGASLYYTLDGSEPTPDSAPFSGSLVLAEDINVLRMIAIRDGEWASPITTATYLISPEVTLPVLSLVIDPEDLFGDDGIYDNIFSNFERPMHADFIELDGLLGFSADAGAKLHGGGSRFNAQKSFRFILRGGYGASELSYPLFEDYPVSDFKRLIFRAHGQDFTLANMRDPYIQALSEGEDMDTQAYRPALTFLNGEYWGVYNIRERHDEFYAASRKGTEDVDLLERNRSVVEGDRVHYDAMLDFIGSNDMTDAANYDYIKTQMEVTEYQTYVIFQVYSGNTDWPTNNIKFWRPRTPDGRWRWMMYDTDFGMGLIGGPENDTMIRLLDIDDLPEWTTELFRGLIVNEEFRNGFLNRYADYLNTRLTPVELLDRLEQMAGNIDEAMPRHQFRWGEDYERWRTQVAELADWANRRPAFAKQHLINSFFQIEGTYSLSLDVSPVGAGSIELEAISVDAPFEGEYFQGIPVTLTARPASGFEFLGWSDPDLGSEPTVVIDPDAAFSATALFGPGSGIGEVVINEINYNSADGFDPGDWVELYNPGDAPFDLSGWTLRDENDTNLFVFPENTLLDPSTYLVLAADLAAFESLFPGVGPVLGDLGYGLGGGGDQVRVMTPEAVVYDIVEYDDVAPWPTEPDGNGPTLELRDPTLDNSDSDSWEASTATNGSPGRENGQP